LTSLGIKLADDFCVALKDQKPDLEIVDQARLTEALLSKGFLAIDA